LHCAPTRDHHCCSGPDADPILPLAVGEQLAASLGIAVPRTIHGASDFLPEDHGEEIGAIIADWLALTRPDARS
jgi:hypothetical protein